MPFTNIEREKCSSIYPNLKNEMNEKKCMNSKTAKYNL